MSTTSKRRGKPFRFYQYKQYLDDDGQWIGVRDREDVTSTEIKEAVDLFKKNGGVIKKVEDD